MRLPLPVRALAHGSAGLSVGLRFAAFRTVLHRLHLWGGQTPEACLSRARTRAALRAEYEAHLELYPARRGRRATRAALPGGDRP